MKLRIHVNRREMLKGVRAWPWTIHSSSFCLRPRHIDICVPVETEYKPLKRSNPRLFLVCYGDIRELQHGSGWYRIS